MKDFNGRMNNNFLANGPNGKIISEKGESIDFNPTRMYVVSTSFCICLHFLENKSVVLLSTQLPPIRDNELNECMNGMNKKCWKKEQIKKC